MTSVALACHAMATRFEFVLHGANPVSLRAAGEEAMREIERLEAQLSAYRPESELSRLNARAGHEAVRVEPRLFRLLQRSLALARETGGRFDPTVGPLLHCWGLTRREGRVPDPAELAHAREQSGWQQVELDPEHFTVRFHRPGLRFDLGAVGKGYALEQAVDLLREAGVEHALLHGGTSTVQALGHPPGAAAWAIALANPQAEGARWISSVSAAQRARFQPLATVELRDESLSVSAVWGKSFTAHGRVYGHVLDPRRGEPVEGALLAACVLPSATETDALSTALLVGGVAEWDDLVGLRPGLRALVAGHPAGAEVPPVRAQGIAWRGPD